MKISKDYIKIFLIQVLCIGLFACDPNRIIDENVSTGEDGWFKDDVKTFSFEINDTTSRYNMYINVRNSNEYMYQNLYLFIEMISPSDKFFMDTVELTIADNKGKWTGSGIGNIWQSQKSLLEKVKLTESGVYKIKTVHGMRNDTLPGITEIGFRVEKIK